MGAKNAVQYAGSGPGTSRSHTAAIVVVAIAATAMVRSSKRRLSRPANTLASVAAAGKGSRANPALSGR